jgi:hypothetical protein
VAELGWTFKAPGQHLHIVVTDPRTNEQGCCLCVNITDAANYHGDGFVLPAGVHPQITKPSVIYFPGAIETTSARIDAVLAAKRMERRENVTGSLLRQIVDSCRKSRHIEKGMRYLLHPPAPPKNSDLRPPSASASEGK